MIKNFFFFFLGEGEGGRRFSCVTSVEKKALFGREDRIQEGLRLGTAKLATDITSL